MSMKNSSDILGIRTRDFPTCSAVPNAHPNMGSTSLNDEFVLVLSCVRDSLMMAPWRRNMSGII
jgi:hypothetical protein